MLTAMPAPQKQREQPPLEPPPLSPPERERIRRALEGYDKNTLIRIALRFGHGLTRELAERSREQLEAAIVRSCGEPAAGAAAHCGPLRLGAAGLPPTP